MEIGDIKPIRVKASASKGDLRKALLKVNAWSKDVAEKLAQERQNVAGLRLILMAMIARNDGPIRIPFSEIEKVPEGMSLTIDESRVEDQVIVVQMKATSDVEREIGRAEAEDRGEDRGGEGSNGAERGALLESSAGPAEEDHDQGQG